MKRRNCDTQCDRQCWVRDKIFKTDTPFRGENGEIIKKEFKSPDEFWAFFIEAVNRDDAVSDFDAFKYIGCWNWLVDDPNAEYFSELGKRLKAAESLNIPAVKGDFDSSPSRLLDNLLTLSNELERAQIQWQKDNTK